MLISWKTGQTILGHFYSGCVFFLFRVYVFLAIADENDGVQVAHLKLLRFNMSLVQWFVKCERHEAQQTHDQFH